jgi:L-fuculose-phosphate aldolase
MHSRESAKKHLCEIAALAYDRHLLDSAGGNFSLRHEGVILCTPRYSGSKRQWQVKPQEIVVMTLEGKVLEGEGETSRETQMHLAIYNTFPEAGGVCHAHPRNVLLFANMRKPIPPTSEQTEKYGIIPLTTEVPAHSEALALAVVEALAPQKERLAKHAIACLLPYHGITVAGRDLDDAYDALERLDGSCHILAARAAFDALHPK